jgi:hypothetical protein
MRDQVRIMVGDTEVLVEPALADAFLAAAASGRPGKPEGLTAMAAGAFILLCWNPVLGAPIYEVLRSTAASALEPSRDKYDDTPKENYLDRTVSAGDLYSYAVVANDGAGNRGPVSDVVSADLRGGPEAAPPVARGPDASGAPPAGIVDFSWIPDNPAPPWATNFELRPGTWGDDLGVIEIVPPVRPDDRPGRAATLRRDRAGGRLRRDAARLRGPALANRSVHRNHARPAGGVARA